MGSPLPPDPYIALGIPKDATAATIKSQYRKLVLKFHPDKVQDEAQKQVAADQFHRIQTAWEIIGDEDKRQRYDAQCKLAELRKDVMERQGGSVVGGGRGPEVKTAAYKVPTEAPRGANMYARGPERVSPTYEERRPSSYSHANASDYFDPANRSSARKDTGYERAAKRTPPSDDRERRASAKGSKESERTKRRDSDRRTQRDIGRDRDRKAASVIDEAESSDPDEYERQSRRTRPDPELRKAREAYHEQAKRDKMDAQRGYYDAEERARKIYSQYDGAREYMEKAKGSRQRDESERRPSPVRMSSSKDKVEYLKREGGRPSVMVRRGSTRPKTAGRETEERRAEGARRSSGEYDDARRPPPPLHQTKSSPADIKVPFERERAASVQVEPSIREEPPAKMKRADTMPHVSTAGRERERDSRRKDNAPQKASALRQTEINEGLPTPGATPDYQGPSASKYKYNQEYADDDEYPTPDGYRTEVRQPASGPKARYTRSPSPMREPQRDSDKRRATSSRYPTASERPGPLPRTTSTSYVYNASQGGVESYSRPSMSRENSRLYGEIPTTRDTKSPRQAASRYSPPAEEGGVRYQRSVRPEDVRMQSGYHSRRASEAQRPGYSRSASSNPVYVR